MGPSFFVSSMKAGESGEALQQVLLGGIVRNLVLKRRAANRGVPVCPQTAKAAGKFRWQ
jgi:hypothetical protein